VLFRSADLGIALDGDADRVVFCDERGVELDGDHILALVAGHWQRTNRLRGDGVVATVMSNLGLERHLNQQGLNLARTKVGDRYVVEHMRAKGFNLGGEQSGHIIMSDFATTGDGLVAALQALAAILVSDKRASEVAKLFTSLPQVQRNIKFGAIDPLEENDVQRAIADGEARLGQGGRLVVRKSGTEPLVRVMAQGDDAALVDEVVSQIINAMQDVNGLHGV